MGGSGGGVTREAWMVTRPGAETYSLSWGYCLGLFAIERAIGPFGVVIVKTAMVMATFAIMASLARRRLRAGADVEGRAGTVAVAMAVLLGALVASQRLVVRPEVVVYLLLAACLWIVDTAGTRRTRWIWALPLLQLVWVNVHSTFVIGLGIVASWVGLAAVIAAVARFRGTQTTGQPDALARWTTSWSGGSGALLLGIAASMVSPYIDRVWAVPHRRLLAILPDASWRAGVLATAIATIVLLAVAFALAGPAGRWWRTRGEAPRRLLRAVRMPFILALVIAGWVALSLLTGQPGVGSRTRGSGADIERQAITELASPWWGPVSGSLTAVWWYRVLAVGVVVAMVAHWKHWTATRRESLWLLVTVAALALSSLAVRGLGMFGVVAVPVIARTLQDVFTRLRRTSPGRAIVVRAGAATVVALGSYYACLIITDRFWVFQGDSGRFGCSIDDRSIPVRAADLLVAIQDRGLRVRPFNSERTGSYLISRGLKVFIDSRAVGNVLPEYLAILGDPALFHAAAVRHRLNVALVDVDNLRLLIHVSGLEQWRMVHFDEQVAVFVRGEFAADLPSLIPEQAQERLLAQMRAALGPRRSADEPLHTPRLWERASFIGRHVSCAWALWSLGAPRAARGLLEDASILDPRRFDEWVLLGQAREVDGDLAGAAGAYDEAIHRAGGASTADWMTLCLSASVELRRGEPARAEARARQAAAIAPDRDEPRTIGLAAARAAGDPEAIAWWQSR